ncbi:DNA cytosine methyltransferase [Polyangium sorediatum]|uniref:DNA cytosine methyltransferase n=1 Tax=Polyangium sorediatum TaxID=889274 RepID=UPI0010BD7CB7
MTSVAKARQHLAIDLFCGAGGMSLGFEQAGFRIAAAVDVNPCSVEVHSRNFPDTPAICKDITNLSGDDVRTLARIRNKSITVVFGGPPCQGFSVGGKMAPSDPRNNMILEFARLVMELGPDYFVLENVRGLLEPRYGGLIDRFVSTLSKGGYSVVVPIRAFDASWFGVPQRRRRVFVLGHRRSLPAPSYPVPDTDGQHCPSVWDAIADLAVVESCNALIDGDAYAGLLGDPSPYAKVMRGQAKDPDDKSSRSLIQTPVLTGFRRTSHSADTIARFASLPQGAQDPVSRFLRLREGGLSSTLRAGTGVERGSFMAPRPIHPTFSRCICLREAARLHSFPDWFEFHHTKWHGFMQVGNSVPPRFARAFAHQIMSAAVQSRTKPRSARRSVSRS